MVYKKNFLALPIDFRWCEGVSEQARDQILSTGIYLVGNAWQVVVDIIGSNGIFTYIDYLFSIPIAARPLFMKSPNAWLALLNGGISMIANLPSFRCAYKQSKYVHVYRTTTDSS